MNRRQGEDDEYETSDAFGIEQAVLAKELVDQTAEVAEGHQNGNYAGESEGDVERVDHDVGSAFVRRMTPMAVETILGER